LQQKYHRGEASGGQRIMMHDDKGPMFNVDCFVELSGDKLALRERYFSPAALLLACDARGSCVFFAIFEATLACTLKNSASAK
jgi:hypothetical protein